MSEIARTRMILTFKDEESADQERRSTIDCLYDSHITGALDVPDQTAAEEEFEIPFGTIDRATLVWVKNGTNQPLVLKLNGSGTQELAAGSEFAIIDPSGSATPTAVSLTTTDTVVGDELEIQYRVFGA